jgi:hypothetical protein
MKLFDEREKRKKRSKRAEHEKKFVEDLSSGSSAFTSYLVYGKNSPLIKSSKSNLNTVFNEFDKRK